MSDVRHPERQYSQTGGMKDNKSKPPVDLLSSRALVMMAEVVGYGARRYKPHNWRMGISWSQTYGSAMRHLLAWNDGEDVDPESGLSHLAHAATQIMFLMEYSLDGTGQDDRFSSVSRESTDSFRDHRDECLGDHGICLSSCECWCHDVPTPQQE